MKKSAFKVISLLLSLIFVFSMVGCAVTDVSNGTDTDTEQITQIYTDNVLESEKNEENDANNDFEGDDNSSTPEEP